MGTPYDDNNGIADALDQLDGAWKAAEPPKDDRGRVPDGKYQARVSRSYIEPDRNGVLRLQWDLEIVVGPCARRHLFRSNRITPEGLPFLKRDLAHAGVVPPPTLRELNDMVKRGDLLDIILEVQAKTKGEYQNIYINATTKGAPMPSGGNGAEPPPPPEDEPF